MSEMFSLILFRFYRNFALSTGLISLTGLMLCYQADSYFFSSLFTVVKILTNGLIALLFHIFKKQDLFYYNNLGFSTAELYRNVLTLDLTIWLVALALVFQL